MFGLHISKSYPLNKIYLSREKLIANYQFLKNLSTGVKVSPVLKSNAYGHGIEIIGKLIDEQRPPFICVDSLYEAYQLHQAGVKSDILIMGYVDPRSLRGKKLPFSYAVFDPEQIKQILLYQPNAKLHLFVDTGMSREGVKIADLRVFLRYLKIDKVEFEGLMSHGAMPRKKDAVLTIKQINNFKAAKQLLIEAGYQPKWFHFGGTFSLLNQLTKECNVIRCGKGIYGFGDQNLQPILSMTSQIIQYKELKKGESVGYDATFVAKKDLTLGVLPIGYHDGIDRRLSNTGMIRIRPLSKGLEYDLEQKGELYADCPVVGRVSMNLTTIDITEAIKKFGDKMPYIGAEIEIISNKPDQPNSIQNISDKCGTIPEEILVHLHPSTRREVY
jgi:alanine racemase